jgi:isopentenyldiphosphate isomerase
MMAVHRIFRPNASLVFMTEEIFDVVNEHDEVIGQNTRGEVHARGLWHRAIHVLVFNSRGEVFLQKRSQKKDIAAGKWDSSASGHLDSGEDYDACVVRELREEIGLRLTQTPQRLFKIDAGRETGWEFCWIYRCESEGPFVLHPDEIETGEWFAPEKVTHWVAGRPQDFASAFRLVWKLSTVKTRS